MKNLFILIFITIFLSNTNAQYFQHKYTTNSIIGNGLTTKYTSDGHLFGGTCQGIGMTMPSLFVTRTDSTGQFTSPQNFNQTYILLDAQSQIQLTIMSNQVIELSDGTGYVAFGSYSFINSASTTIWGLFYVKLDVNGNVIVVNGYQPSINVSGIWVTSATESIHNNGDVYATGNIVTQSENRVVFAISVDNVGNLYWGNLYDFKSYVTSNDIIQSPYDDELIMVGGIGPANIGCYDGLWLGVSPINGSIIYRHNYTMWQNTGLGTIEEFTAINLNSNPLSRGFIVCGYTNYQRNINTIWVLTLDQYGNNVFWSNIYQINGLPTECNDASDVIQRLNSSLDYEYYVIGAANFGTDVLALKIDKNGNGVTNGFFRYDQGGIEKGMSVDINNLGTADGVSFYCYDLETTPSVTPYTYVVKAYYNGVSCSGVLLDPITDSGNVTIYKPKVDLAKLFSEYSLEVSDIIPNDDILLCNEVSLGAGDNSLIKYKGNQLSKEQKTFSVYPNPAEKSSNNLIISSKGIINESINISIFDYTGKLIFNKKYSQSECENNIVIDINSLNISSGIYNIIIKRNSITESYPISILR